MATTEGRPQVFARKASGLSRVMSPWSACIYNFLTMGVIFPWSIVWAPEAFPGCSVWMACLFAVLLELPIAVAYVWMTSGMPRSGGDYVFQSRVFGGAVGFPIVLSGFVIWSLQWLALAGWLLATVGVAPLLLGLGVHYESASLINAGIWVEGRTGTVVVSIIGIILMTWLLASGFKHYVRLQHVMFAATVVIVVIMVIQFLRTSPASFAEAINHFNGVVEGNSDYYRWIQSDVSATGFNLFPKFAIGATLLAAPIAWTSTMWATWSAQLGGEIKGARVFKNQLFIMVGSLIGVGVVLAVIAAAEQKAVGTGFFNAVSASYYGGISESGNGIGSVLPFPAMYAIVISPNPIITVLVAVGFMLASLQITCNTMAGNTRIIVATALDRVLPSWFAKVSPRFRTPANAHLAYMIGGILVILGYNYVSSWYTITLGVTFAGGYVFMISSLAAAFLPYRARALYEAAPGSQYKLGGIPLVTIFGVIGAVFAGIAEIAFLTQKGYGLQGTTPYVFVAVVLIATFIYYWIRRWYQKDQGIDVTYAFREVPPE